jgi:cobaltochelatase CobT
LSLATDGIAFVAILIVLSLLVALFARAWRTGRAISVDDGPEDEPYRVYTREFDLALSASEVLARLESASPDSSKDWLGGNNLDRTKAILETDAILADQQAKLAENRDAAVDRLRLAGAGIDPTEIVAALLIDQSGSMKGRPISLAAVTATLLTDLLSDFGARSEVLGFSTAGWQGGHARMKWLEAGRPARPGRLCALMHVIYKSAGEAALGDKARQVMVHADLLRENIDGEAIQWARERLDGYPEPHKLLIVISDGAPVDDSTLAENGPNFLYHHLMTVFREIETDDRLTLGGIGINHRVDEYYPLSETVLSPDDLPEAGARLLERLIAAAQKEKAGFPPPRE